MYEQPRGLVIGFAHLSVCAVLTWESPVLGGPIDYPGIFHGSTVDYDAVRECSATDPLPLYGVPAVSGNTLAFESELDFSSYSSGAFGTDTTDGKLFVQLTAHDGVGIEKVSIFDTGNFPSAA